MPLYEYKCVKCGKRYEKIESLSAPEKQKCPKCGGRAERQIAAPAIQFKGSGWYVTDYGAKGVSAEIFLKVRAMVVARQDRRENLGIENRFEIGIEIRIQARRIRQFQQRRRKEKEIAPLCRAVQLLLRSFYSLSSRRYARKPSPSFGFFSASSTVACRNPSLSPASCVRPS